LDILCEWLQRILANIQEVAIVAEIFIQRRIYSRETKIVWKIAIRIVVRKASTVLKGRQAIIIGDFQDRIVEGLINKWSVCVIQIEIEIGLFLNREVESPIVDAEVYNGDALACH
jgi:hypothetical protein